ncbi:MAG: hypothetical protein DMF96_27185 [Acidobacteria bacterium]|nr:MAG: hypothetical protein DMF96_27185 [Acidobacteriota bacterium]
MNTLLGFPPAAFSTRSTKVTAHRAPVRRRPDFRALFFVYLYGAYEHCIVDGFREALIAANAHGLADVEVRPELAGLAFNRWFDSLESAPGAPSRWQKRTTVTKTLSKCPGI